MSSRENIEVYHPVDADKFLLLLKTEYGAHEHPSQGNGLLIGDPPLPFYKPERAQDHWFILGFNKVPLSPILVKALIDHPEIAPDEVFVRWTDEQELVMEGKLGDLRRLGILKE